MSFRENLPREYAAAQKRVRDLGIKLDRMERQIRQYEIADAHSCECEFCEVEDNVEIRDDEYEQMKKELPKLESDYEEMQSGLFKIERYARDIGVAV